MCPNNHDVNELQVVSPEVSARSKQVETIPSQDTLLHEGSEGLDPSPGDEASPTESSLTEVEGELNWEDQFKYHKNRPAPPHQFLTVDSYLWHRDLSTTPSFGRGRFSDGAELFWNDKRDGCYKADCEVRTLENGGRRVILSLRLQLMPLYKTRWLFADIRTEFVTPGVRFLNVVELQTIRHRAEPAVRAEEGVEEYTGAASNRLNDPKDSMMTILHDYGRKSITCITDEKAIGGLRPGLGLDGYFLVLFPVDVPDGTDTIEFSYKVKLHRQGRTLWFARHSASNEGSVSLRLQPPADDCLDSGDCDLETVNKE